MSRLLTDQVLARFYEVNGRLPDQSTTDDVECCFEIHAELAMENPALLYEDVHALPPAANVATLDPQPLRSSTANRVTSAVIG